MREIRMKTITKSRGHAPERTVETAAMLRAEALLEGEDVLVHVVMHADGTGAVLAYQKREIASDTESQWIPVQRLSWTGDARTITHRVLAIGKTPHSAADNFFGT